MAIHLTPEANPTVQEGTLYVDSATGEFNVAGRTVPHIIPGVLYPAVSGNDISGTALGGSYVYGTAHTDGRKYYYTDIKGSKPIKDPRIGAHFGSQRHKFKSLQLLEQETATHGKDVHSIDGREWARVCGTTFIVSNTSEGNRIYSPGVYGTDFFEIVGYFSHINLLHSTHSARPDNNDVIIDGSDVGTNHSQQTTVANPLGSRYVDDSSVSNVSLGSTALGIHTLKYIPATTGSSDCNIFGIELIAQDTSNRNNIQIPSQNVVSYGKKFNVSGTPHYDPFNGFTSGSSVSSYIDTATSLGVENWKNSSTYYRPYNGGRVVKWVDSSGVIKTSVTLMPPNAQNIGGTAISAKANASVANDTYLPTFSGAIDDSLSEVAKTFHWREFGNGAANLAGGGGTSNTYADASMLYASDDIAYVMDDGLTSLVGDNVNGNSAVRPLQAESNSDSFYITFIGTGITMDCEQDTVGIFNFAQNLPYGTHVLKVLRDSTHKVHLDGVEIKSGTLYSPMEITFHQPKKPPIPEDAVVLCDYMLMADFVPQTSAGGQLISKGVRRQNCSRDVFYDETDDGSLDMVLNEETAFGFRIDITNGADSDTSFKMRIPSFGTNYVHRGYQSDTRTKLFIGDTDNDSNATKDNTASHGSYAHLTSDLTLGIYNFGANAVTGQTGFTNGFDIVTPIHTSHHYQFFETPFLHELVGGDRNMEQNNLVVSPDGKTWDEITRDTSYIGDGVVFARATAPYDSDSSVMILDDWRGHFDNKDFYNKDSFAISYDRVTCLKDGQYILHFQCYRNTLGDRAIKLNGAAFVMSYQSTTGTGTMQVTKSLKRGDYLQVVGRQSTNTVINFFWIKKA